MCVESAQCEALPLCTILGAVLQLEAVKGRVAVEAACAQLQQISG